MVPVLVSLLIGIGTKIGADLAIGAAKRLFQGGDSAAPTETARSFSGLLQESLDRAASPASAPRHAAAVPADSGRVSLTSTNFAAPSTSASLFTYRTIQSA